ncbi:MAG: flagellar motor stator protein MotA [Deltaproteobacteria bacterium]|nr:flagellar motor stator protein MotA [Deltaproteobacteria bacterium]
MLAIAGIIIVFLAVMGGFKWQGGNVHVLIHPAELLIIGGAALGSLLIASPKRVVRDILRSFPSIFKNEKDSKKLFVDILLLLFQLLTEFRREGVQHVERMVNTPHKTPLFKKYSIVLKNEEVCNFICDNFKIFITTDIEPHEFDNLMEIDMETQRQQAMISPLAFGKLADSLPGLGIVAAVLGVVLSMGKMSEAPEVLGRSVGAALVGTFLGVLACYGFVGPMSTRLEYQVHEKQALLNVIKTTMGAVAIGMPPAMAVESGRRAIPSEYLERILRSGRKKSDHSEG